MQVVDIKDLEIDPPALNNGFFFHKSKSQHFGSKLMDNHSGHHQMATEGAL